MRLREDWRKVLNRAWSVRLMALTVVLSGLETIVSAATTLGVSFGIPPGLFAVLAGLIGMSAMVARLVSQQGFAE
jgi:hypothetical protein